MADPIPDLELIKRAQAGDIESRNALIVRHLGFIHSVVQRVMLQQRRHADSNDLVAVAIPGFIRAIETYDEAKGARLITYAALPMEQRVRRAIWQDTPITRPGAWPKNKNSIDAWMRASDQPVDIFEPEYAFIPGCSGGQAYARLEQEDRRSIARWAIDQLDKTSQEVIVMRFVEGMKLDEVGAVIGVCKKRVRQIQNAAIERMRQLVAA